MLHDIADAYPVVVKETQQQIIIVLNPLYMLRSWMLIGRVVWTVH